MTLVEITPDGYGVEIDIAYATVHNFTGRPVYRRAAGTETPGYQIAGSYPLIGATRSAINMKAGLCEGHAPPTGRLW